MGGKLKNRNGKTFSNGDRVPASEAYSVHQQDRRIIWVRGGCRQLPTDATGDLRERHISSCGSPTADIMMMMMISHYNIKLCL